MEQPSMKGKHVLVTGPTSGIGKEIARGLTALGANLVLGCRDVQRGRQAARELSKDHPRSEIVVMHLEASSQGSIRDLAHEVRNRYSRLDVLINNAGLNRHTRQLSADGIEMTFATNVLAYYLLTAELLPLLKRSAPSRIINIASTFAGNLDLDDLQYKRRPYNGTEAYAQSKACDRLLTWALARRLAGTGITANAVAPGLVPDTGLYREVAPEIHQIMKRRSNRTPAEGADTAVWLASSPELEDVSGKFFEDREEIECEFRNPEVEDKLWHICQELTGTRMNS